MAYLLLLDQEKFLLYLLNKSSPLLIFFDRFGIPYSFPLAVGFANVGGILDARARLCVDLHGQVSVGLQGFHECDSAICVPVFAFCLSSFSCPVYIPRLGPTPLPRPASTVSFVGAALARNSAGRQVPRGARPAGRGC